MTTQNRLLKMPKHEVELMIENLRATFDYCPTTGKLSWKEGIQRRGITGGKETGYTKKNSGYMQVGYNGRLWLAHQIIWLHQVGVTAMEIDHIDGDPRNNRMSNLREVTRSQNNQNIGLRPHNKSGHTGVIWNKRTKSWRAFISADRVRHELGHFKDFGDAINARREAEVKLHGGYRHAK